MVDRLFRPLAVGDTVAIMHKRYPTTTSLLLMDYLNYRTVAEIPPDTYAVHLRRARAVEVLVRHFDRDFYYFLRKRGKKKVTIFFKLPATPSRCWMCCAFLSPSSATIAEDLVNIFINRIADILEYENKTNCFDTLS